MTNPNVLFQIKKRKAQALTNRRLPIPVIVVMAGLFAYFFWEATPYKVIYLWILPNLLIVLVRTIWVNPFYDRVEITEQNVNRLLVGHVLNVFMSGLIWSVTLPFFFVPDNTQLLFAFFFAMFVIASSASISFASYTPAFMANWTPFVVSLSVFFFSSDGENYIEYGLGFLLYNLYTVYLYKRTNAEVTGLITTQLEKQLLAESLEVEKKIAEDSVADKNRFLASASHDLRQPLHSAGLLLSVLGGHLETDESKRVLDGVSVSFKALNDSFHSLLDVSKLDAGVMEVNKQHLSLRCVINDVYSQFEQTITQKNLAFSICERDVFVFTDPILLSRILGNLLSNAINYTDSGSISLFWQIQRNNNIVVSISDTGAGIPSEEIENIFSEYYQLHNPERDRNKGFGLGLAIVKKLCDLLDIKLTVESEVGVGTAFSFTLAVGDKEKVVVQEPHFLTQHDLTKRKVLIVDDNVRVLNSMTEVLELWGCDVFCAESGDAAVELIKNSSLLPEVIIADYRLRDNQTGVQAYEYISDEFNLDVPAIIVTGDTSPDRLREVTSSGHQILHKPVAPEQLRGAIYSALEHFDEMTLL